MSEPIDITYPIIILDLGSKKIKGLLVQENGSSVIDSRNASYIREGIIDSMDYILKTREILRSLVDRASSKKVLLGITGQRASITGWSRDLNRVTPVYTWRDEAAYKIYEGLKEREDLGILEMFLQPGAGILRVRHILNIYSGLDYIGGVESLILYDIFGESITDYSFAYAYGILEPFTLSIIDEILSILDIDRDILPRFLTSNDLRIKTRYMDTELELSYIISDQSAALAGDGCFEKGCGKVTLGTGAFIDYYTDTDFVGDTTIGVNPMLAWIADGKPRYMAEYFIYHSGDALDSVRNLGLDVYKLGIGDFKFDSLPLYLPSYSFLTTETRKRFRGAVLSEMGLNLSLGYILQAIIASIGFLIYRGTKNIKSLDVDGNLYASGGWSNCKLLLQIISQFIRDRVIVRSRRSYSTLYGVLPFILSQDMRDWSNIINHFRPVEEIYLPLDGVEIEGFIERLEAFYSKFIS